ncbi:hypothetical protein J2Y69_002592 [Microbacterium resistens]|uniref:DUF2786 domain-containing protein n=1 Tax=Microbacterium resistens TaxID=156977 RepID=A0ABU1SEG2_9MICO|nr:hypothetical protein [Microbacterium resistens]MDR6867984.1 hypothetical protein [Microbacterium resistens]
MMPLAAPIPSVDVEIAIGQILRTADEALEPGEAERLRRAAVDDLRVRSEAPGEPVGRRLGVKAADGSDMLEVLRVVAAAVRAGLTVELSLGHPLADRLHRGLLRAGASVRVETADRWAARAAGAYERIRVVGPERSRRAALRRATDGAPLVSSVIDVEAVDLEGTGEIERFLVPCLAVRHG